MMVNMPLTVFADVGPKPSITVTFQNVGDRTVYASFYEIDEGSQWL